MELGFTIAGAVIHAQALQVQIAHIAIGSEHIVIVANGAVGIHVQVTALIGA